MSDANDTVSSEEDVSKWKKKWWPVIQKVVGTLVVSAIGFLCAWLFNSVVELRKSVATLNESIQEVSEQKQVDRDQWRSMSKLNDRVNRTEIETEVNRRVQQTIIDIIILKNFGEEMLPPPAGDDDDDEADEPQEKNPVNRRPPPRLHQSKDILERLDKMKEPTDVDDYIQREQMVLPQTKK